MRVLPTWDGTGTVKVIITDSEFAGAGESLVQAVSDHIEKYRPIGAVVTVVAAETVNVAVNAELTIDENADISVITTEAERRIAIYLKQVAEDGTKVRMSRVCAAILGIDGVIDCTNLKINNSTSNLDISDGTVPVLTEVTFHEATA